MHPLGLFFRLPPAPQLADDHSEEMSRDPGPEAPTQWTSACSDSGSSSSNLQTEVWSHVAPLSTFRGETDLSGHVSFTHRGPIVKIPDISLQPSVDVQPLISKGALRSPVEQGGMGRHIDVLGNQRGVHASLIPGTLSVRTSWATLRWLVFQPLKPSDVQFTSSDLKFSLIALICIVGAGKRRSIQTGPQSQTGWAVEVCWPSGSWRGRERDN